jgi:uncharacterized membrane protein
MVAPGHQAAQATDHQPPLSAHPALAGHGAFGNDGFGQLAEKAARFFGTPQYILGQTVAVLLWVLLNSTQLHLGFAWDVYPFIALNLLFSLQAAYAAPLILLAQTRQADRDKLHADLVEEAHNRLERSTKIETDKLLELLNSNTELTRQDTELTQQVVKLTTEIHALISASAGQRTQSPGNHPSS